MATTTQQTGLGTKKSVFVLITVVGCIAILWPKILYFAMFGGQTNNKAYVKDHRGGTGCCDVVLDQEISANVSDAIAHPAFRKRLNLITGEMSLRQERPPHLRPDGIHPAMRERGRAIPVTSTVPILTEDKPIPLSAPRIVEGRPGPIPGMRPPLGAGANHQANHKGNSLGLLMPLYTVGIIAFFVYTVMKLVMKKPLNGTPYAEAIKSNPEFQEKVFGQEKSVYKKVDGSLTNLGWHANGNSRNAVDLYAANLHRAPNESELEFQMRETEQLLEISLLKKKLLETEQAMSRIIADMSSISKGQDITDACGNGNLNASNGNVKVPPEEPAHTLQEDEEVIQQLNKKIKHLENGSAKSNDLKPKDVYNDKSVKVANNEEPNAEPQSIFLEGSLPHDSQILVADSETKTETVFDNELDECKEEPAVVICSKMTLSLINMDPMDKNGSNAEVEADNAEMEGEDVEEIEEIEEIEDEEVEEYEIEEELENVDKKEEVQVQHKKENAKTNGKMSEGNKSEEEVEEEEEEVEEEEEIEEEEVEVEEEEEV
ncbi:hypothetical protein Bhyg_15325 [Pseudolycoriella hygida]|uniref:Resistance to inhibitors of cholinesterase protein 3 N-terminal domain-containing protein n=1 Tax=Pseudolycoriella hygida TaxID=35572 RepID=A0A9Q0RY49_9DIPT|nr:hypothetical protein Bhyg_15325 [Pseudolycoriella hygida]